MLEALLDYDSRIYPYVVWYCGRRKNGEGFISDGAGQVFWKMPEQSGFFSIKAEVFPARNYPGLAGYQKEISLLVSSQAMELNLVTKNIPDLIHWYVFENDLFDSKNPDSKEQELKYIEGEPLWMGVNGTYGLVTGKENIVSLPVVLIPSEGIQTWQVLFRFLPLNDGSILSILFGSVQNASLNLLTEGQDLVFTLSSPFETVSVVYNLPDSFIQMFIEELSLDESLEESLEELIPDESFFNELLVRKGSFLTMNMNISVLPDSLTAQITIIDNRTGRESVMAPVILKAEIINQFEIFLGSVMLNNFLSPLTAIWDEFALYYLPALEIITITEESDLPDEE